MTVNFEFESMPEEEVRKWIHGCEGLHSQQVSFSTFHDCLTQVCFGCKKVRSSIKV